MTELVFYTNPQSRGRITRWMLEELGEPYDTVIIDYEGIKGPDFLAINPMGKLPALTHGGVVVTEGAAICAYLADAFPEKGLAPPIGDARRGTYFRWLFFGAGPVEAAVTNQMLGVSIPPERKRAVGYGCMEDVLNALEIAVGNGPYLCGDQFTAADVYTGSQIGYGIQFGMLEKRPAFEAYFARISARPAARRAAEIDDAEMAKQAAPQPA